MQSYILTCYRHRKNELVIPLGSHERILSFLRPRYPDADDSNIGNVLTAMLHTQTPKRVFRLGGHFRQYQSLEQYRVAVGCWSVTDVLAVWLQQSGVGQSLMSL